MNTAATVDDSHARRPRSGRIRLSRRLCTLIVLVLQPGKGAVDTYGSDLFTGHPDPDTVSQLFFPPAVSLTALTLATVLGVVKPWGRIRRGRPADA